MAPSTLVEKTLHRANPSLRLGQLRQKSLNPADNLGSLDRDPSRRQQLIFVGICGTGDLLATSCSRLHLGSGLGLGRAVGSRERKGPVPNGKVGRGGRCRDGAFELGRVSGELEKMLRTTSDKGVG